MEMNSIGNFKGISSMAAGGKLKKAPIIKHEPQELKIEDNLTAGFFAGNEIKDPRAAFKPEIKETNVNPPTKEMEIGTEAGVFGGSEISQDNSLVDIEGYYMSGMNGDKGPFQGISLNGPSSSSKGIVSLSGQTVNNPTFLRME